MMFATYRARCASVLVGMVLGKQGFAADRFCSGKSPGLKILRWKDAHSIEKGDVGRRSELSILRRFAPETSLSQSACGDGESLLIGHRRQRAPAHGDRLEMLAAHHGAGAGAAGKPSVIRYGRVTHASLAGDSNRRYSKAIAELSPYPFGGFARIQANQVLGGSKFNLVVFDDQEHRRSR
jgi:hypothetical protein